MAIFCYIEAIKKFIVSIFKQLNSQEIKIEYENIELIEIKMSKLFDNFRNNTWVNFAFVLYLYVGLETSSLLCYMFMAINLLLFWLFKYFDKQLNKILKHQDPLIKKVFFLIIHDIIFLIYRIISIYYSNDSNLGKYLYPCLLFLNLYLNHYYYPVNLILKFTSFFLTVNLGFNQFQYGFLSYFLGIIMIFIISFLLLQGCSKSDFKLFKYLKSIENQTLFNKIFIKYYPNFLFILEDNNFASMNNNASNFLKNTCSNDFLVLANSLYAKNDFNLSSYINNSKEFESQVFRKQIGDKVKGQYSVSMSSFENDDCHIKILSITDISKLIEERDKEVSQNFEGIILFSAAHEIRSQLNIINGYLEKLEEEYSLNFVYIAKNSSQILECKFGLLFDFVHLLMKKFKIHLKEFKIQDLIFRLIQTIKPFSKLNENELITLIEEIPDVLIQADYDRLFNMLVHISMNAIKYTSKGSIIIRICKVENSIIQIKIQDSGIGMNNREKVKLIECISDPDPASKNINSNSDRLLKGIGLKASFHICQRLGGSVNVESCEDKGTTICLSFSLNPSDYSFNNSRKNICDLPIDSPFPQLSSENYSTLHRPFKPKTMISMKILNNKTKKDVNSEPIIDLMLVVVDDLAYNREIIVNYLKRLKYDNIFEIGNGLEAIKFCKTMKNKFRKMIIFMDIDMPVMNGIDASSAIKLKDKANKIEIVIVSAFSGEDTIEKCKKIGIKEFYFKPVSFVQMKEFASRKMGLIST